MNRIWCKGIKQSLMVVKSNQLVKLSAIDYKGLSSGLKQKCLCNDTTVTDCSFFKYKFSFVYVKQTV